METHPLLGLQWTVGFLIMDGSVSWPGRRKLRGKTFLCCLSSRPNVSVFDVRALKDTRVQDLSVPPDPLRHGVSCPSVVESRGAFPKASLSVCRLVRAPPGAPRLTPRASPQAFVWMGVPVDSCLYNFCLWSSVLLGGNPSGQEELGEKRVSHALIHFFPLFFQFGAKK